MLSVKHYFALGHAGGHHQPNFPRRTFTADGTAIRATGTRDKRRGFFAFFQLSEMIKLALDFTTAPEKRSIDFDLKCPDERSLI
jgi:hypothetical protein